ncbi:NAD(P)-binding protein [Aureobasidium pullulans]|uniref:NAD(P)-binding protein n=1 Tax=Aureobasidium pullulans TaxID=5580 RepID=A0AB74IWF1_AURPU|nr:NAD(P)-binding protein [Aureobasidium pullulans]
MSALSIERLFGVKGYVAVVTGGSSGLGFMISKGLVANGVKVYVVALPTEPIKEKVAELNDIGRSVGGSARIAELAAAISSLEDHIDVLVSNAGVRRDPPIPCHVLSAPLSELQASMWSSRHSDWAETFCVNTTAHYFLSVAMLPLLSAASEVKSEDGRLGRDDGRGAIVMTSSCASMHNATNVDLTSYATSKAATDHLVRLLAAKFSRFYVRVVGINPGCELCIQSLEGIIRLIKAVVVPSNMNPVGKAGNMFSSLFDRVPAKRAGRDEDIAGAVIYLISRAGAYIDGVSVCIDGGRVLVANGQE